MNSVIFIAASENDTDRLGTILAEVLPDTTVVSLLGTLGAGKTRLVQAVAVACGLPADDVNSPTFVLCQHYQGTRVIHHFDAYRLKDEDEFLELGPEEYFDAAALTFVEWGDRVSNCLPQEHVEITITVTGDRTRQFEITSSSDETLLARLSRRLDSANHDSANHD